MSVTSVEGDHEMLVMGKDAERLKGGGGGGLYRIFGIPGGR